MDERAINSVLVPPRSIPILMGDHLSCGESVENTLPAVDRLTPEVARNRQNLWCRRAMVSLVNYFCDTLSPIVGSRHIKPVVGVVPVFSHSGRRVWT